MGEEIIERREVLDISPDGARTGLQAIRRFQAVVREVMTPGVDFGTIPGCGDKPTLLKPGAEKIAKLLKCFDGYEFIEKIEDWDKPLFHYLVRCTLSDMATGTKVSSGIGEANSYESKHRYRWIAEDQLPPDVDKATTKKRGGKQTLFEFEFALKKRETAGQYGKPETYWAKFDAAIQNKTARSVMKKTRKGDEYPGTEVDTDTTLYQITNPDIFDQVNTLVKMAKKRALVDATLSAGRLSELFTQDIEDFADDQVVTSVAAKPEAEKAPAQGASQAEVDAGKAKAKAEYEASKSKPLARVHDEFDPGPVGPGAGEEHGEGQSFGEEIGAECAKKPAPKPAAAEDPDGPALKSLEAFGKIKAELQALGISEGAIWTSIHRYTDDTFKKAVVELSEFTTSELDAVNGFLNRKLHATKADRAKAAKEKANV